MAVIILEDHHDHAKFLTELIASILPTLKLDSQSIYVYNKVEKLTKEFMGMSFPNIYFVDVQIGKDQYAGFDISQKIRGIDTNGIIVFVTSHSDFALLSYKYKVSAFHFIEKNIDLKTLEREITACLQAYKELIFSRDINEGCDLIPIKIGRYHVIVPIKEIIYFMAGYNHNVVMVQNSIDRSLSMNLKDIVNLHDDFLQIHRSYVINRQHIVHVDKSSRTIRLSNKEELPVSRTYYKSLMSILFL